MMFLENPLYLLVALLAVPLAYRAYMNDKKEWKIVNLAYIVVVILLAVAAASPQVQASTEKFEDRELIYLTDESRSMIGETSNISIPGVSVRQRRLASGNSSRVDRGMMSYLEPNKTYLVSSDFRTSGDLEEIINSFKRQNSTVHVLKQDLPEEQAVSINGPSITVPGATNTFTVDLSSTKGNERQVSVKIDGEEVKTKSTKSGFKVEKTFDSRGYHRVVAEVQTEDRYEENNRYYKSVKVVDKPEILVVGDEGRLDEQLSEFFQITGRSSVPEDPSEYYAVVMKKKAETTQNLKPYLIEGNGLVYTGDGEMDVLPVEKSDQGSSETENAKLIIAIDISIASGKCAEQTCFSDESRERASIKPSKTLAYNIIHNLPRTTRVGIVAYNDEVYRVSEPKSLAFHRDELMSKVSRINVRGPSLHNVGLEGASAMVEDTGNVITVSDGEITGLGRNNDVKQKSYQVADNLPSDVKLFTIGVGEETNENFLSELATRGNGAFYQEDEFYGAIPMFQGGGGSEGTEALSVVYPDHFITRGLSPLSAATARFDSVSAKPSAQTLVTSTSGKPALTTWRYGLGRVASFSAGDKDLSNILSQEPQLVARSVSWASGNPQRKDEKTVTVESARRGEKVEVRSTYEMEGLTRRSDETYAADLQPSGLGFHSFQGHSFAYNYREEIQDLGYDDEFIDPLVRATGGEEVTPSEIESIKSTIPVDERTVVENRSLSNYFLIAALLVFLAQVGYRKLNGLI
jgi:hypothetical protein